MSALYEDVRLALAHAEGIAALEQKRGIDPAAWGSGVHVPLIYSRGQAV